MTLSDYMRRTQRTFQHNAPEIYTALGISGVVTTAYLVGKAAYEIGGYNQQFREKPLKDKVKVVWKKFIPATISGGVTVGFIVASNKVSATKTAAAYSLLSVTERAFSEYKEKVVETLGENKEQRIRDDIARDHVRNAPVTVIGTGHVLCYEEHTGRYFNCDMETLRRAQNDINAKLINEMEVRMDDFYHMVGLPWTSYSGYTGWTVDKFLELRFSTVMSEDNRPCISFEYNYVKAF